MAAGGLSLSAGGLSLSAAGPRPLLGFAWRRLALRRGHAENLSRAAKVAHMPQARCTSWAELAACGLDRLIVVACSVDTDPAALRRSNELVVREVLPELDVA
jgi:hypothetical protein